MNECRWRELIYWLSESDIGHFVAFFFSRDFVLVPNVQKSLKERSWICSDFGGKSLRNLYVISHGKVRNVSALIEKAHIVDIVSAAVFLPEKFMIICISDRY